MHYTTLKTQLTIQAALKLLNKYGIDTCSVVLLDEVDVEKSEQIAAAFHSLFISRLFFFKVLFQCFFSVGISLHVLSYY